MSGLYFIPISGLKEGRHSYDFEINKKFFEQFEESEVKEGALTAVIEADKRSTHIDLTIRIKGFVTISCDRCLGAFGQPVDCENRLLVKFGKGYDESDPDLITIPADENELDLNQYFYEYILLALPIQRVHPNDKNGNSTCDPEMLDKLKEHIVSDESENDPRWDELKKLMNNN
ncbi:MAG: DUF177 domain-containing protein [Bacteroidales bacterium]|jgi:uncharacterized metal-binding protein YceD (DUF177 family)|nr:DUF177 domain-containing protein [Bacteroidales bacterium]